MASAKGDLSVEAVGLLIDPLQADLRTPIPTTDLTSLKIEIMSARVHLEPNSRIPVESEVKIHPDITSGRQGGALV